MLSGGRESKARAIRDFDGMTRRNVPKLIANVARLFASAHLSPGSGARNALQR